MSKVGLFDSYMEYNKKYRELYGPKTVVWMEAGGFVEIYGMSEKDPQIEICPKINLTVTRRNSNQENSPYMAGFPSHATRKYAQALLDLSYTIVLVAQVTPPPNVIRKVTQILSPGTNLSMESNSILCSILLEQSKSDFYASLCWFDTNIGSLYIQHVNNNESASNILSKGSSREKTLAIIREKLVEIRPNEIILNLVTFEKGQTNIAQLKYELGIANQLVHYFEHDQVSATDWSEVSRFFPNCESAYGTIADALNLVYCNQDTIFNLILLLKFLEDHNPNYTKFLSAPIQLTENEATRLMTYNGLYEKLDIFREVDSFAKRLNLTKNGLGGRLWKKHICNPLVKSDEILKRYDKIDFIQSVGIKEVQSKLAIVDIERIYRSFGIQNRNPSDLNRLENAHCQIEDLYSLLGTSEYFSCKEDIWKDFLCMINRLRDTFDFEKCAKVGSHFQYNFGSQNNNTLPSLFKYGIDSKLDSLTDKWNRLHNELLSVQGQANALFKDQKIQNPVSLKFGDRTAYLETTKTKMKIVQKNFPDWTYTFNSSNAKAHTHRFIEIADEMQSLNILIHEICCKCYHQILEDIYNKHYSTSIKFVCDWIAEIDVMTSHAAVAQKYNYCRPEIITHNNGGYFEVEDLRHPIIELLIQENQGIAYVPNSIKITCDKSYLLFGVNSAGKSSLLKSIALAILSAQSGCFVAASKFKFSPYHKIFIRTGNTDDMFRNHSSFVKEMTESNVIWNEAQDQYSLVLADELCASTEHDDALKIVATIVETLAERKVSFVFASHMLELASHEWIVSRKNIHKIHMKVDQDENKDLIFDRRINEGMPKVSHYGVHVAKKIIKNAEFAKKLGRRSATRTSRYNRNVKVTECQRCGYQPESSKMIPLETHHISFQCTANETGFHGHIHKNKKSNLVVLCRECHTNVHKNKLSITGYQQHENGRRLEVSTSL